MVMFPPPNHNHKDSGSRDEEQDMVLVRDFYKARTKTTPRFWVKTIPSTPNPAFHFASFVVRRKETKILAKYQTQRDIWYS